MVYCGGFVVRREDIGVGVAEKDGWVGVSERKVFALAVKQKSLCKVFVRRERLCVGVFVTENS